MAQTDVQGFHRTRYSMSMSESHHKRNASDSEIKDMDADDESRIEDLRKFSAANDDDSKAADAAVKTTGGAGGVTPLDDPSNYTFADANDNQDTSNDTTTTTTTDTPPKKSKGSKDTKSSKGKSKGGKDKTKTKTQKKGGNDNKSKAKTAKAGKKSTNNKKSTGNQSKSAKKTGNNSKTSGRTSKVGKNSGRQSKVGKNTKGGKSKTNPNTKKGGNKGGDKNGHNRRVSVSKKPNLKASNAKKIKDEKRRQSLQTGKNTGKKGGKVGKGSKGNKGKKNETETKEDIPDETPSAETNNENSNTTTDNSGSNGSNGGRGKKKAWYLSGGPKIKQQSQGSKMRTWHEKKKDAQLNDILRRSEELEKQVLSSYHLYAPNMKKLRNKESIAAVSAAAVPVVNPPAEAPTESPAEAPVSGGDSQDANATEATDAAGDTEELQNIEDAGDAEEQATEATETPAEVVPEVASEPPADPPADAPATAEEVDDEKKYDLSGKLENVDMGGIVIDVCQEMFLTLHESWEGRLDIVEELCNQLIECYNNCDYELYYLKFTKFIFPLCHQFSDWRSSTIIGLKERFSKLVQKTPEYFVPFTPHIIRALLPCFAVKIEVLREASIDLGETIVMSCYRFDSDHLILNIILEGLQSKHDYTRCTSAEYLEYLVRSYPVLEASDGTIKDETLLETVDKSIRLAVKDRALQTRENGYRSLHIYETLAPTKANEIISRFSKAVARKYKEVLSRKASI